MAMPTSSSDSFARRARLSTKSIIAAIVVTFAAIIAVVTAISDRTRGEPSLATDLETTSKHAIDRRAHDSGELTPISHETGNNGLGPHKPAD